MGKWLSMFVLTILIIVCIQSAASAGRIDAPLPSLEGARTHTHWLHPGSYQSRVPIEEIQWIFPELVRLAGGKYVFAVEPLQPGEKIIFFSVTTTAYRPTATSIQIGWSGSIGGGRVSVRASVRAQLCKIVRRYGQIGYDIIATREAAGFSEAYAAVARDIPVGRWNGESFRVNLAQGKTGDEAERQALENAFFALIDRSEKRTSVNELIVVQDVDGDEITLSAGRDSGVHEGQTFAIFRKNISRDNPNTGEVLDQDVAYMAMIRVTSVKKSVAFCEIVEGDPHMIAHGDRVVRSSSEDAVPAIAPQPRS